MKLCPDWRSVHHSEMICTTTLVTIPQTMISELGQSVRTFADKIKFLSINASHRSQVRGSPGPSTGLGTMVPHSATLLLLSMYGPPQQPSRSAMRGPWFPSGIPAPQASRPALPVPTSKRPQGRQSGTIHTLPSLARRTFANSVSCWRGPIPKLSCP